VSVEEIIKKTKEVILNTADNYSSMLQSIQQRKKTEIESINGKLASIGEYHKINVSLIRILTELINSIY
jgi:ketopantoate reductase